MKDFKQYNSPDLSVIELTEKYGVMQIIGEGSTHEALSRETKPYTDDNDSAGASRYSHNVWSDSED